MRLRVPSISALVALVLVAIGAAANANAQALETGTVIAVAYSKQRIVVAADSRASFMADGFQDEVCKIANPSRKVLFAASGMVGAGDWYASDVAKQVAARLVGDNPYLSESSLQNLAEAWGRAMAEKIRTLPPQVIQKHMRESQTSALFAGLDRADEVNVVQVRLTPVSTASGIDVRMEVQKIPVEAQRTLYLVFGRPQIAMEFLDRKTERAQAEVAKWPEYFRGASDIPQEVAIRLVDLTGHFDPRKDLVGGSTAAIRMDGQGGVRWLKRPGSCY